jgi:hypothetical protein
MGLVLGLSLGFGIPGGIFAASAIYRVITRPSGIVEAPYDQIAIAGVMARTSYRDPDRFEEDVQNYINLAGEPDHDLVIDEIVGAMVTRPVFCQDERTDSQAYVWHKNDTIYLAFRGTEHYKDAIADADVRTERLHDRQQNEETDEETDEEVDEEGQCCVSSHSGEVFNRDVRVHQGFHRQFFSIEGQITPEVQNHMENGTKNMIISGHSLGGGLASLATYYYSRMFENLSITSYTFGSPRVGNGLFANDECHRNGYRIYNYHDPVAMVPFSCRFDHVSSTSICVDDSTNLLYSPRLSTDNANRDVFWLVRPTSWLRINLTSPGAAHSSGRYVESMINLAKKQSKDD